jgi:magnesium chelatase subunit I
MVFTANPEDYTNRGSIITPLKDRIDSQILTHYPKSLDVGLAITAQEAWQERDEVSVSVPHYLREVVEQVAFEARQSEYVDQKSGVSARLTRAALEGLYLGRRAAGPPPRRGRDRRPISDLYAVEPAVTGKVELVYEGEQEGAQHVAHLLIGPSRRGHFKRYFPDPADKERTRRFQPHPRLVLEGEPPRPRPGNAVRAYAKALDGVDGLRRVVAEHAGAGTPEPRPASAMEFVLEALHQHSLLGKDRVEHETRYSDMMGSVLGSIGRFEEPDDDDDAEDWEDYGRLG